jgi:hypothetical protein
MFGRKRGRMNSLLQMAIGATIAGAADVLLPAEWEANLASYGVTDASKYIGLMGLVLRPRGMSNYANGMAVYSMARIGIDLVKGV